MVVLIMDQTLLLLLLVAADMVTLVVALDLIEELLLV